MSATGTRFFAAMALCCGLAAPALAVPAAADLVRLKAGEIIVHDLEVREGGSLEATFFVQAPPAVCRQVLWDHERFPAFMPSTRTTRVLSKNGNTHIVEQVGGQGPVSVRLVSARTLYPNKVTWRSVGGDVKRNDGEWRFEAVVGGSILTYKVHLVPNQPVPAMVTRFLQKQALPAMVKAVRARVEAIASLSK